MNTHEMIKKTRFCHFIRLCSYSMGKIYKDFNFFRAYTHVWKTRTRRAAFTKHELIVFSFASSTQVGLRNCQISFQTSRKITSFTWRTIVKLRCRGSPTWSRLVCRLSQLLRLLRWMHWGWSPRWRNLKLRKRRFPWGFRRANLNYKLENKMSRYAHLITTCIMYLAGADRPKVVGSSPTEVALSVWYTVRKSI